VRYLAERCNCVFVAERHRCCSVVEGAGGRVPGLAGTDPLTATDLLGSGDGTLHQAVLRQLNET